MKYLSKRRFTMRQVIGLLTIVFLGIGVMAYAVSFSDFTSGSTISSSEMNTKLNALKDAINKKDTSCQGNSANDVMVKVGNLCVDKYEASVWSSANGTGTQYGAGIDDYPAGFPDTGNWTTQLYAVSRAGVTPSTSITWFQAQQACALSGKRLLTNAEWQMAAAGTPDSTSSCNVSSGVVANTGANASCVSNYQVNDMVGNVWEWVADWMQGNTNPWMPGDLNTNATYGNDAISGMNPAISQGGGHGFPAAIVRGGTGYSGSDWAAGVFNMYAGFAPSYSYNSIGFRCAR